MGLFNLPDIRRVRIAIAACLKALSLNNSIRILLDYRSQFSSKGREKQRKMEFKVKETYFGAIKRCLRSLSFKEMDDREVIIEEPAQNTCQWIYEHRDYQWWDSEPNRLLWIKGKTDH